jgi:hypothetical protein
LICVDFRWQAKTLGLSLSWFAAKDWLARDVRLLRVWSRLFMVGHPLGSEHFCKRQKNIYANFTGSLFDCSGVALALDCTAFENASIPSDSRDNELV